MLKEEAAKRRVTLESVTRLIANFKGREDPFENAFDYFDILGSVKACVCSRDGT